jgi:geranylgeranyl diphosphate synthase type II
MEVDFKKVLEEKKKIVWKEIEKYLKDLTRFPDYCQISPKYQSLVRFHQKITSEYPQRKGKYIRPTLVLLTAAAMGFSEEKAIRTAAAMQVSEDWILNHDDIEDDSLERRGKPVLHRLYGKELAINAGDALHILMWKILWDNRQVLGEKKAGEIAEEFFRMLNRTTLGQTIEIYWTKKNKIDLTDEEVLLILESKTAYYTIAGPMRLGAILAGASREQLEAIYEFGRPLGYCFQIRDDILDLTSDFSGLKKQTGNDIYEGKWTIMLAHLFRTAKEEDKKRLLKIMVKKREEKTAQEVNWVIELMKKYGSLDYAQRLAERFARQAQEIFEKKLGFLKYQPARDKLKAGIEFILKREY